MRVLVEDDVTLVLDELAGLEDTVDLGPTTRASLQFKSALGKTLTEGSSGFPSASKGKINVSFDVISKMSGTL